jgi:membrane protein implicated in regulation of membrane protease activity
MITLLEQLSFWHWLALALVLLIVEAVAFNGYLLWIAISAAVVSMIMLATDLTWQWQLVIFAFCSVISTLLWYRYWIKKPVVTEQPLLNQRTAQFIGRVAVLIDPIVHGTGKIKLDDSNWKVSGEDLPAGSNVRVVGVKDELTLIVESADS